MLNHNKIGRYEVVTVMGQGAMGTVYKAADPVIERDTESLQGCALRAANLKDPRRRKTAIQHLRPEIEDIKTLAGIVEQLENP